MFTLNIPDFQYVRKEDQYKIYLRSNDVLSLSFWENAVSSYPLDWTNLFAKNRKQKKKPQNKTKTTKQNNIS